MRRFFTKKRIVWTVIILLLAAGGWYLIFGNKKAGANIQTQTATKQNLELTVLATGEVVSKTDLNLSFQTAGVVKYMAVKEGDKVKSGRVLATLDQANALATLTSAQGALAQAQANYDKVLAGASSEQIAVQQKAVEASDVALANAETNLANVRQQQATAVKNAYNTLLNTPVTAISNPGNNDTVVPTISGTYAGTAEGYYKITTLSTGTGLKFQTTGLETYMGDAGSVAVPLGTLGLYIQFPATPSTADSWTVYIPNTYSASYVVNENAYQAALKARDIAVATAQATVNSAQVALAQAQASLDHLKARARPADINAARAQILSAQGQVALAQASIANSTLTAPADGTITSIDIKLGELALAQKEVMILQDTANLHLEADISEANIDDVKIGQTIDVTYDALGPDRHFTAEVITVNPASTVISGVVNFKVTAKLKDNNIMEIKPGMTANMVVLVAQKNDVLAVPSSAVVQQNNKSYVRLIDDPAKKTYHQAEVQTGLQADGGLVEIISGLTAGQEVVVFIKK